MDNENTENKTIEEIEQPEDVNIQELRNYEEEV